VAETAKARDPNRRVPFEEAGPGVYLLLTNAGIRTLRAVYDVDHIKKVNDAFMTADIPVLEKLLDLMPHKDEARIEVKFDDLDTISLQQLTDKLRDAWSLSIHGMTFEEQMAHLQQLLKEANGEPKGDPLLTSPADGSDTSSEQPTGQA